MWHAKNNDTKEVITALTIEEILDLTAEWEITTIWFVKQS